MAALIKLAILFFKFAKLGKVLLTVGSMLFMIWVYQLRFGWPFSVGAVLLLFVHEMGHYVAARRRHLHVGAPLFIPFVGAYIALREVPHDVETEAYVALAGPLAGTLGAIGCYAWGHSHESELFLALAYWGFFINLFNMIPLSPLDGGRVTAVLSPRIWLVGLPILAAYYFLVTPSAVLGLVAIMALPSLHKAWHYNKHDPANAAYYAIRPDQRWFYLSYYFVLTGFLIVMVTNMGRTLARAG